MRARGFSMIELLIVLAVIFIIISIPFISIEFIKCIAG